MEIVSLLEAGTWLIKRFRPAKVLLAVEDSEADALLLREELDIVGMKYEIVKSAEEALGLIRKTRFSAALIDMGLPAMDGATLAKKIRDIYPKTRIFFITGNSCVNLSQSELMRIIRKPITAQALREMIL